MSSVEAQVKQFGADYEKLRAEIGSVIVGQREVVDGLLTAIIAGGHVLLEGLPGLGKTQLIKTVADVLDLKFSRIQCTPDLMPADILGTTILSEDASGKRSFEFQRGPIFGNIVLTDEINRATPKTQSALLQAMQEGAVTAGTTTHQLAQPFFVLATQNPVELEGTYPLPEAQLDRFMLKLLVPPSNAEALVQILERTTTGSVKRASKMMSGEQLLAARALMMDVAVAPAVLKTIARLVLATHPADPAAPAGVRSYVKYGASPRGAQSIVLCAKVMALCKGRYHVALDDVRATVKPALRHRLILNFEGEAAGIDSDAIIDELLKIAVEA